MHMHDDFDSSAPADTRQAIQRAQRFLMKHADYFRWIDPLGYRQLQRTLSAALARPPEPAEADFR